MNLENLVISANPPTIDPDDLRRVQDLVEGIHVVLLTTLGPDGTLRARPMMAQQVTSDGVVWFLTESSEDARVLVAWSRPARNRYVVASGVGEAVDDRAKVAELWSSAHRAWFPDGTDASRLTLLKVTIERVEWWDAPGRIVGQAVGLVKALVRGEPYNPGGRGHGTVALRAPHGPQNDAEEEMPAPGPVRREPAKKASGRGRVKSDAKSERKARVNEPA